FIALRAGFKAGEFLIGDFEKVSGLLDNRRVNTRVREEVLLRHNQRIAGGTGLLEATVRLTKEGLKRIRHAGKRSGIHRDARREASADDLTWKRELKRFGAVALKHSARGAFLRETHGLYIEHSADGVTIGTGLRIEREINETGDFATDLELHEPARALF